MKKVLDKATTSGSAFHVTVKSEDLSSRRMINNHQKTQTEEKVGGTKKKKLSLSKKSSPQVFRQIPFTHKSVASDVLLTSLKDL